MNAELQQMVLQRGPIGRWRTALGTASVLMSEHYEFDANGSGRIRSHSAMFGEEIVYFEWQVAAAGVLRLREVDPSDPETDPWSNVPLEFREVELDTGKQSVLVEKGRGGFWISQAPLAWNGPLI